jgi:hypothetical protein
MNDFKKVIPTERGLIIAKLYHNMWYDKDRFNIIMNFLDAWDKEPVKEAKYLNEIQESVNINDLIN